MPYPAQYRYTKEHEWISADGTDATVGITDYAQSSLGDIVFVELPKVGDPLEAGKIFGTVTAINTDLKDAPEKINADANTTWMLKLTLKDPAELDTLLTAAQYEAFVAEETGH
jgi:glycine cleavage system H protein